MSQHTELPWGVTVLDRESASDKPALSGAMIVSPPGEESVRRLQAGETPFTSRRVAKLEASYYTPHEVCVANARLIARAVNAHEMLLAACREALALGQYAGHELECVVHNSGLFDRLAAAIAKAEGA